MGEVVDVDIYRGFARDRRNWLLLRGCGLCIGLALALDLGDLLRLDRLDPGSCQITLRIVINWHCDCSISNQQLTETYSLICMPRIVFVSILTLMKPVYYLLFKNVGCLYCNRTVRSYEV